MLPHVFEVGIAHVVDAEDEDVLVGVEGGADGGEERSGFFFRRFLLDRGEVDGACAFGFRHLRCCIRWDRRFGEESCRKICCFGGRWSLQ